MVLMMLLSSSFDGTFCAPFGNTRFIGSNNRDSDFDKYAFSNGIKDSFSITLGLKMNRLMSLYHRTIKRIGKNKNRLCPSLQPVTLR